MTIVGIDISNHNNIQAALEAQPWARIIVVRLPTFGEPDSLWATAREQTRIVLESGRTALHYGWCYGSSNPVATIDAWVDLMNQFGTLGKGYFALDCETYERNGAVVDPGPDQRWLDYAFLRLDDLHVLSCIYTGQWWWNGWYRDKLGGNPNAFADRKLWDSFYDGDPDFDWGPEHSYGAWSADNVIGWQYAGAPLDLDIFREEMVFQGQEPAPVDQVSGLINGLAYVCDDLGDKLAATILRKPKRLAIVNEMRRVREQMIGPRP